MYSTIVVLTNNFPFGKGESFLETEIKYLSRHFNKVILISSNIKDIQTRVVPVNVEVKRFKKTHKTINWKVIFFSKVLLYELIKLIKYKRSLKWASLKKAIGYFLTSQNFKIELEKILKEDSQSHLLIYSYWTNEFLLGALFWKSNKKEVKVVSRAHSYDLYEFRYKDNYIPFRSYIYKNIDKAFIISSQGEQYLKANYINIKNQISIARLGIDNPLRNEIEEVDYNYHEKNKLKIVSCSNIVSVKRIEKIIDELLFLKHLEFEWVHIGTGDLEEEIIEYASQKLKPNNIKYQFLGYLENSEVYNYFSRNKVDLFVNLSEIEGIPVSFMEAQSFGIPIIATNVGGVSEIVNNDNGYLIEKDFNPGDMARCVENYCNLTVLEKRSKRTASFNTWITLYQGERNYTEFCESLRALLGK